MPKLKTTKWVQVFKAGKHTSSSGEEGTYTENDLEELTNAVNESVANGDHRVPAVLGHPKHDEPAYGWVDEAKRIGGDLFVKFKDIANDLADAVNEKKYQSISIRLYPREHPNNPTPGKLNLGHVGFFGAVQPAIKGMKPVELGELNDGLLSFSFSETQLEYGGRYFSYYIFGDIANVFRQFREYLIEQDGIATADRIVPGYVVDSLARTSGMEGFSIPDEEAKENHKTIPYKEADVDLAEAIATLEAQGYGIQPPEQNMKTRLFGMISEFQEAEGLSDAQISEALGIKEADFMAMGQKKPKAKNMEEAAKLLGLSPQKLQEMMGSEQANKTSQPEKDMEEAKFATKENLSDLLSEIATVQLQLNKLSKVKESA